MLLVCAAVFAQNATVLEDRKLMLLFNLCLLFLRIDQISGLGH